MWRTDTRWLDVAVVMSIFGIGNVLFGRFEEHKPRWRRLLKIPIVLGIVLLLASTLGRAWAYGAIGLLGIGALWVHAVWLPRHGVSGWTAEPRRRYLALMRRVEREPQSRAGAREAWRRLWRDSAGLHRTAARRGRRMRDVRPRTQR